MKTCRFHLVVLVVLCYFFNGRAAVLYVHPDSSLSSIQVALDLCEIHDTVLVGPGTYCENIIWPHIQGINLLSEFGPDTTIIDGNEDGSVIHLSLMPDDSTTVINGFTIRNGNAWLGGGIHSVGGRPMITDNIITDNVARWPTGSGFPVSDRRFPSGRFESDTERSGSGPSPQGGGIYTVWSSAVVTGNIISNNHALQNGGGVACFCDAANIAPLIYDNTIVSNSAHTGGGVYINCPFTLTVVKGNTISDNDAVCGGGVACYYAIMPLLKITRNLIAGNTADSAGGGIWCYLTSRPIIDSCIISGNSGDGIYSGYNSSPLITYNNIIDNTGFGVRNDDPAQLVSAPYNWWGDGTGPYHPVTNPGGTGDTVSDYVDFTPWLSLPGTTESMAQLGPVSLLHVYPNPFINTVHIRYSIPGAVGSRLNRVVSMKIFDSAGRLVKSFDPVSSIENRESSVCWDGTDRTGRRLPRGVYFVRFEAGDHTESKPLVLISSF